MWVVQAEKVSGAQESAQALAGRCCRVRAGQQTQAQLHLVPVHLEHPSESQPGLRLSLVCSLSGSPISVSFALFHRFFFFFFSFLNQDELVKCIAITLHNRVKEGHLEQYKTRVEDEIFNELLHPINNDKVDSKKVPTFDLVFDFLNSIYRAERLAPECLVMCLAYIDRMLQSTPIRMHASNWRRLILSSLILASKVWEVRSYSPCLLISLF